MKTLIAIIRPEKTEEVLSELAGRDIRYATVSDVIGRDIRREASMLKEGGAPKTEILDKVKLEITLSADELPIAIEAIKAKANTGDYGDGKIFILDMEESIRIRTSEKMW